MSGPNRKRDQSAGRQREVGRAEPQPRNATNTNAQSRQDVKSARGNIQGARQTTQANNSSFRPKRDDNATQNDRNLKSAIATTKRRQDNDSSDDSDDDDDDADYLKRNIEDLTLADFIDEKFLNGKFTLNQAKTINVLFIGRSGTGKSTFIKQLINPMGGVRSTTGFSTTRTPEFHACTLISEGVPFQLNLLDTPGLNEFSRTERRKDEELIQLSIECVKWNLTFLNAVVFVSKAGYTYSEDIEVFQKLMGVLGERFSSNAFLLLTHAEDLPKLRLEEYKASLKETKDCKEVYDYCKKGVLFSGAINWDSVYRVNKNGRQIFVETLAKRVRRLREKVLQALIDCADGGRPIAELQAINEEKKLQESAIIEAALKKRSCVVM